MSEKEKKKRAMYQRKRERWAFVQIVLIAIVTVAVIISSIVAVQLKSKYYVNYRESGGIDYKVALKENEFFEEGFLDGGQSYVASLIDRIIADFSYEIDMDSDDVSYQYSYTINSRLEIIDNSSKVAIFDPEYELINVQNKSQKSSDKLNINEIVVINYDEYNDLANRFIDTYDLTNTTSSIVVTLTVNVLSNCEAFTDSAVDAYTSELRIPLTTKTVNVKMTAAVPDEESNMIACTRGEGSEVFKTTAIVLGVVDALMIAVLIAFMYFTKTADITYTARVKRIISQYKSYIQRINNLFETKGYQVILVNEFDEMLEIRDTIQAPILMYENADKTCAKFMIPTDSKLLYTYTISIEGYEEPENEAEDPSPAITVQPNITNIVRPVVKVVLNPNPAPTKPTEPEPIVENILEEPEIEADDAIEVVAATEEFDETDSEIDELIAAIPEIDEPTDGVDAIDVFWKERPDKTYRYDPDENTVEKGDTVLVPTRDNLNDREVIREAEVAKGNYKVAPEMLDHPLKKIIGVVRRKAEELFTAMITVEEDDQSKTDGGDNGEQ